MISTERKLAGNKFLNNIDQNFSCKQSTILRYKRCVFPVTIGNKKIFIDDDTLQEISILEGVKIYPLIYYKGVKIFILDETSLMASGTFKSLDACISIAIAKSQGIREFVFESGGNTGTAFSIYAAMMKLRTFFVAPLDNIQFLSEKSFTKPYNYLIAVRNPQDTKVVSERIAEITSAYRIPSLEWRYIAATFRGYRILEYLMEKQNNIDWFSQTISGGFGPIGIYKVLNLYREDLYQIPRFLGVQQRENCPYYTKIKGGQPSKAVSSTKDLLIPVMYDSHPFSYKAFDDFKEILNSNGNMLTIDREEFNVFVEKYLGAKEVICQLLEANGAFIYKENDFILDKAGLVGLAGVFKAVDLGIIKKDETVLHSFSSGTFKKKGTPKPDCIIDNKESLDAQLGLFMESLDDTKAYVAR